MTKEKLKEAMNISPQESLPFELKIKNRTNTTLKNVSLFNPNHGNQSDIIYHGSSHPHTGINNYQDFLDAMAKFDPSDPFCAIGGIAIGVEESPEYTLTPMEINTQIKSEITLSPIDSSSPQVILNFDVPSPNVVVMGTDIIIQKIHFPLSEKSDLIFSQLLPNVELIITLYQKFKMPTQ